MYSGYMKMKRSKKMAKRLAAERLATDLEDSMPHDTMDITRETETQDAESGIEDQIAQLYNNNRLADVRITVGNTSIPAHRLVLCLRSAYFSNALEGNFVEGQTNTLRCEAGKEHAYLRMLQFFYQGDYEDEATTLLDVEDDSELMKHPRVYFLADSYMLGELKSLALLKFKQILVGLWSSEEFYDCIEAVFANTSSCDDEMRMTILGIVGEHVEEFDSKPWYQSLVARGGDFTIGIVAELTRRNLMLIRGSREPHRRVFDHDYWGASHKEH